MTNVFTKLCSPLGFIKSVSWLLLLLNFHLSAAVLVKDKQWPKGSTLNVLFLDGTPTMHKRVTDIAPLWLVKTSLKFSFYSDLINAPSETHIRISFNSHSGSQLGNHKDFQSRFATMNLQSLNSDSISDKGIKRLILHEFGHALGLEHEYRSKNWPYGLEALSEIITRCYPKMEAIGYNKDEAISHCSKINQPIQKDLTLTTAYDENSIMNYSLHFVAQDGTDKKIEPSFSLSILDRHALQQWYGQ